MRLYIALLCSMALCRAAFAVDDGIAQACKDVESGTSLAYNLCTAAMFKKADTQLNELFGVVVESAQAHVDAKQVVAGLRASQRAWLVYRDRTCELASWIEGHVRAPARRSGCMTVLTQRRILELEEMRQCIKSAGSGGDCPLSQ